MRSDEIKQAIENGFARYYCSAKIDDYGHIINFKVYDQNDKAILTVDKLGIRHISKNQLQSIIDGYKDEIKPKRIQL